MPQLESAFARITQLTIRCATINLRASYNAKLEARRKAQQVADAAPKATDARKLTPAEEGS